jgi:hypothetical protein
MSINMSQDRNIAIFLGTALLTFGILTFGNWLRTPVAPVELNGGYLADPITENGVKALVPSPYILNTGLQIDEVPPITQPNYISVLAADARLNDTATGLSLETSKGTTFYPTEILNYHYVVMDSDDQGPFALTYCVFCHSGVAYNTPKQLRVSEYEYNNNVLLQDIDGNLWQQLTGTAVHGNASGEKLPIRAGLHTATWGDWKEAHPEGRVLSSKTGFERDYGSHPFGAYDVNDRVYYPLNYVDARIPEKDLVNGVVINDKPYALVNRVLSGFGVYQDRNSELPLVTFFGAAPEVHTFNPIVGEQHLTFEYDKRTDTITDSQTGSDWSVTGRAIAGSLAGTHLTEYQSTQAMSMCWLAMHPDSIIPEVQ